MGGWRKLDGLRKRIGELHAMALTDVEIAKTLNVSADTVLRQRAVLKLPRNSPKRPEVIRAKSYEPRRKPTPVERIKTLDDRVREYLIAQGAAEPADGRVKLETPAKGVRIVGDTAGVFF